MEPKNLLSTSAQIQATRDHRRQTFWQILLPVILISLALLAIVVLAMVTTAAPTNDYDTHWANISLIWLSIPTMLSCLIFMVVLFGFIFIMTKALGATPLFSAKILYYTKMVGGMVRNLGDKAVSPVMNVNSGWAGLQELVRRIRRR